jgi:CelD/BcsL family acetyltransferase involved in cellulose biosynthesis
VASAGSLKKVSADYSPEDDRSGDAQAMVADRAAGIHDLSFYAKSRSAPGICMSTAIDLPSGVVAPVFTGPTSFQTLNQPAQLHEFEERWTQLDSNAATPMQTYAWIDSCAATFGHETGIDLIVGCKAREVVAAAPLVRRRGAAGQRRELVTYRHIFEPVDLVYRDANALLELTSILGRRARPLIFERLFAASPTTAAIAGALGRTGRMVIRPQAATPWIALDPSWADPQQKLSSRRRSDFRRACRQAEQVGHVHAEHLAPDEDQVDRLLDHAFEVERRSWKGGTGTALADSRAGDFYRRYARRMAKFGQFRVELLHIGEQVAAMQLGVVHQNRYWVLKVGYDPQFNRASPGILLMVETIKQAVVEGLETYELLGTVEPWIQVWTELERPCVSIRYYPLNWSGGVALAADLIVKARSARTRS